MTTIAGYLGAAVCVAAAVLSVRQTAKIRHLQIRREHEQITTGTGLRVCDETGRTLLTLTAADGRVHAEYRAADVDMACRYLLETLVDLDRTGADL